jgi:hypothetical protein
MSSSQRITKRFIVKKEKTLLPNNFIIQTTKRNIYVVECHLQVLDELPRGYTLYSNIPHSEPYVDGFTCFINEYFDNKCFKYKDIQLYELKIQIKDLNDEYINLNEIVMNSDNSVVNITPEQMDPEIHKFKYRLHLELILEH